MGAHGIRPIDILYQKPSTSTSTSTTTDFVYVDLNVRDDHVDVFVLVDVGVDVDGFCGLMKSVYRHNGVPAHLLRA